MRCLKRRISDAVYRKLLADAALAAQADPAGHCGASQVQRDRPAPAHRHCGSALPRPRTLDAARDQARPDAPHLVLLLGKLDPPVRFAQRIGLVRDPAS